MHLWSSLRTQLDEKMTTQALTRRQVVRKLVVDQRLKWNAQILTSVANRLERSCFITRSVSRETGIEAASPSDLRVTQHSRPVAALGRHRKLLR